MNTETHRGNRAASLAIVVMALVLGLAAGTAGAQANPYTVTFTGVTYDVAAGTSTWNYNLTWNPTDAAPWGLSHFGLQLCSSAVVVGAFPSNYSVGLDPSLNNSDCHMSDFYGIKWDGAGLIQPGQTIHFSVTLQGLYKVGTILTTSKAGTKCNLNTVPGPDLNCNVVDHPICSVKPSTSTVCAGQSATFEAFVAGGVGPYTYAWTGPNGFTSADKSITVSDAGNYAVVVTDSIGLTSAGCEASLVVNELPKPAPGNYEFCEGTSVELDAGDGFASYLWSNGATTRKTTVNAAGTYTVTVTNANGCSATASHTVVANPKPKPAGSSREICEGETATLDAGDGFASYKWSTGDTTQKITVSAAGTYTVTVTNDKGCAGTAEHVVIVNPTPKPTGGSHEVCEGKTVTLDAGDGFAGYLWSTGATTQKIEVSVAGTYTVTVTTEKGCKGSAEHVVTVNPLPEPKGSSQEICEGKTATLDAGDGFASYLWSTGATTQKIDVTEAGTYTVTVTNGKGCEATASHVVVVNPLPEPKGTSREICEGKTATLDAGDGFASYKWSTGATTQKIDVTEAGTYTVTVTNGKGCEATASHVVVVNPLPEPKGSSQEICEGATATLDAGDGFASYLWSTGATTQKIDVKEAGTYTVTVTSGKGCEATASHVVIVNPLPKYSDSRLEICQGGEATFDLGNLPEGWSVEWTGPGGIIPANAKITVSEAGDYFAKVTTDKGCSQTSKHTLVVNPLPEPQGSSKETCEGTPATLDAGAGFASYKWSTGATTQTIEVTAAGIYTVTVTTDKGCSAEAKHELIVNAKPDPKDSDATVCDGEEHTFDAGAGDGWTYKWSNGSTEQTITVKAAGTYTVTVTNAKGCSTVAYHKLTVNPLPPADIKVAGEVCAGSAGNAASTPDAGAGATYEWSITNGTINSAAPYGASIVFTAGDDATTPVTLSVTVTSAAGCKKSDTAQSATKACIEGCSLTQGAWGSLGGAGTLTQVAALIGVNGLQVGVGSNSFNVKQSDAPCLVQVLPAGGSPKALSGFGTFTAGQPKCTTNPNLIAKNNGKLNNTFLGQMLTLTLNLRDNADLAAITLCATMRTQAVIHTANGDVLNPGADGVLGTADDPIITVTIPQSVLSALDAAGLPRTTLGLLELGNRALGGLNVGASVSDVNAAVDAINIGFDGCRIKIDCVPVSTLSPQAMQIVNGERSVELCTRIATFDRTGEVRDLELADSVLDGIRALELPVDLKGLARLADVARSGEMAGVPVDELNMAIDAINAAVGEGRMIGGCEWR
jgi:hypothetical protein